MFGRFFTVAALALAVTEGTAAWADAGQTIGRLAWPGGWPSAARHFQADDQGDVGSAAAADPDDRTLYVTGMIGSSFAAAEGGSLGGRLFTGEAALGVAVPRPAGAVRLEFEGRQHVARAAHEHGVHYLRLRVPRFLRGHGLATGQPAARHGCQAESDRAAL